MSLDTGQRSEDVAKRFGLGLHGKENQSREPVVSPFVGPASHGTVKTPQRVSLGAVVGLRNAQENGKGRAAVALPSRAVSLASEDASIACDLDISGPVHVTLAPIVMRTH